MAAISGKLEWAELVCFKGLEGYSTASVQGGVKLARVWWETWWFKRGGHRVGCWAAAPGLSSAGKPPGLGVWVPPGTTLATGAGCLAATTHRGGQLGIRANYSVPPIQARGWLCAGVTPACTAQSQAGSAAEPRGEDAPGWPLATLRGPSWGTGGPTREILTQSLAKTIHYSWAQGTFPWAGCHRAGAGVVRLAGEGCPGGMRGRGAGSCSGWLPEQRAATLLFSGSVHIIEF